MSQTAQDPAGPPDNPVVAVDVIRTPGLTEGLESGWYAEHGADGRFQFARDLECYLTTPGVADSPMAEEMLAELDLTANSLHTLPDMPGLMRRVLDFLRQRRTRVLGRHQFELPLTAYELWVPPVAGATASATMSSSRGDSGSFSFTMLGIGGGPSSERTFGLELTRSGLASAERLELVLDAVAEHVEVSKGDRVEARYARLVELADRPLHRFVPLPPDQAPAPAGSGETLYRVELPPGRSATTIRLSLADTRSWSMSFAPRLELVGTEFRVGYERQANRSLSFDFHLPDGYRYAAVGRLDRPAITWTATPIGTAG